MSPGEGQRVQDPRQGLGCCDLHTFLLNLFFCQTSVCASFLCVTFYPREVNSPRTLGLCWRPEMSPEGKRRSWLGPSSCPATLIQPLCPAHGCVLQSGLQKGKQGHGQVQDGKCSHPHQKWTEETQDRTLPWHLLGRSAVLLLAVRLDPLECECARLGKNLTHMQPHRILFTAGKV